MVDFLSLIGMSGTAEKLQDEAHLGSHSLESYIADVGCNYELSSK